MVSKWAIPITEAAVKLTRESLKIADSFVAYATDWEFKFENMHKILKQCGASAATMKMIKKIGWLD